MFSYEQVEEDIYQRLLPFQGISIDVVKLPDNEADFKRAFAKGKITIGYKGSKWDAPRSTSQIAQEEKLIFEVAMQSRELRGSRGLYMLKRVVTQALTGFQPTDCNRMYPEESGMTGVKETFTDGVWTYSAIFHCTTLTVEDFEEDLTLLLKKITTENRELGDTLVVESAE